MGKTERKMAGRYFRWVFRSPHSIWISCLIILGLNFALFYPVKIWEADLTAMGIQSRRQLLGLLLLFTLLPMWLFVCFFMTQRHSLALALKLEASVEGTTAISDKLIRFPGKQIAMGSLGGLMYALAFNTPHEQISPALKGNWASLCIIVGQVILWVCVGVLLLIRVHVAGLFSRLGREVKYFFFEQSSLQPFARVGMLDVVIVMGGMAIATVQSIDAQFRLENYLAAVAVAGPAALVLLVLPMWQLHNRIVERRVKLLAEINSAIRDASEHTDQEAIRKMEELLQRRDRVKMQHTWPLDISILRRLALYVLIPPLAWAGAALVEVLVDRALQL